jgi:SRSO17 transposase
VPEEVIFSTKPELAARTLWRTLDAGLGAKWVTGDTVYRSHHPLREGLEARSQAYALAVSCQERVQVQDDERKRVDHIADGFEPDQWQ